MLEEAFSSGSSPLHRLDPRAKLLSAAIVAFSFASLQTITAGFAAFAFSLWLTGLAWLPFFQVAKRLALVNGFILFLWIVLPFSAPGEPVFSLWRLQATSEGIHLAGLITLKSNAVLLIIISLVATTPVPVLGQALSSLKVPEKFAFLLLLSYRYLNVIQEEYGRLRTAAKVRCFRPATSLHTYRTFAHLVAMVFIKSFERGKRVHEAMLLRGFTGRFHTLQELQFCARDVYLGLALSAAALGLLLLDLHLLGRMVPAA